MTGVALHHQVRGPERAPVLLLGASLGTTLELWPESQLRALEERMRVVRFDARGHGRSPAPPGPYEIADLGGDVLALMSRLGIERASYCGVSIGGMVGMWLAANAPDRIENLVLVCTSAHVPPASAWAERAAAVLAAGTTEVVADTVVGRWVTPAFASRHPDVVSRLRAMLVAAPPEGYAACCGAIERMDLRADLASIRAPTLVIAGANDEAIPPDHGRAIAAAVAGARLEVLSPAAHLANVEQPGEVARLILTHCLGEPDALHDAGMRVRREVLGAAHVDRTIERASDFTAPFQDLITRFAWGSVWTRAGLDRRTRSCITLAVLTALRAEDELAMHVRAARRNGLTPDEIREVLLHTAVYAGVPAANTAFAIAQRVLDEEAGSG